MLIILQFSYSQCPPSNNCLCFNLVISNQKLKTLIYGIIYLPNNGSAGFDSVMGVLFSKFKERKDTES